MKEIQLVDPASEGEKLLVMDYKSAMKLFQSYSLEQKLSIIEATREPHKREELYYLVPDCTELIQNSKTEDVLQILHTMLGSGLACGILSAISAEQFEEIVDITIWHDGKLDEESLNMWIGELGGCDDEDLARLLPQIDIAILADLLRGKVELRNEPMGELNPQTYKGLFAEEGILGLEALEYENEQVQLIMETIWNADQDYSMRLLYEIFAQEDPYQEEQDGLAFLRMQEEREKRIRARDEEAGISIDEEEMFETVDLENLELTDDERTNEE